MVPDMAAKTIWTIDMAVAALISIPEKYRSKGIITVPPPIPIRPETVPPINPININVMYSKNQSFPCTGYNILVLRYR